MKWSTFLLVSALLISSLFRAAHTARIRGTWKYKSDNRLKYLTKFGIEKGHEVFAYGSSVRSTPGHITFGEKLVLAFIPAWAWEDLYNVEKKTKKTCEDFMSGPFNLSMAPDSRCSVPGTTEDLFRVVPCDYRQACQNQPQGVPLVAGSNLTFRTVSPKTQFYYLFLVGCQQNSSTHAPCLWSESAEVTIDYNIHIVNKDPDLTRYPDPFIYEFSFHLIGMMIIYIIFACIYFALVVFNLAMHSCVCTPRGYKHHRITLIFSASLLLEFLHVVLVMTHYAVYSEDGVGLRSVYYVAQAGNFVSDWLLILVLILIGKGWQLTTATVRWKKITLVVWILYIVFSAIFFIWTVILETLFPFSAEQNDNHQSVAAGLYLAYRLLLLLYILWEMRQIYLIENRRFKLILYRCLLVLYLLWFCYLPVAVVIASILNPLDRARVIAVFVLTFDLIINIVMVLLFCPQWSQQYFQFSSHLNTLTRVSMRKVRSGHTQYRSVSNSFSSTTDENYGV